MSAASTRSSSPGRGRVAELNQELIFVLADAFRECDDIGISGVIVGDKNVRLHVNFRLDLPRGGWNALCELSNRQNRSRGSIMRWIAQFIWRSRLQKKDFIEEAEAARPMSRVEKIADRIAGRYGE